MEGVLLLTRGKKRDHFSRWGGGVEKQHLMELMFVVLTMLILSFNYIIYNLLSILYISFLSKGCLLPFATAYWPDLIPGQIDYVEAKI